ncbi:PD-(D/E)XK nuclease-like domain-containing protein [Spirosoma litoris]
MQLTDHEYRVLPAYANSDLSELFNLRTGNIQKPIDPKAAQFGTTFHSMILEPHKPIDWTKHHIKERHTIMQMQESFTANASPLSLDLILAGAHEVVKTWTDPITGLPCKAKLDNYGEVSAGTYVIDLKTTSARSSSEFFDCFIKYGYDRQAAYYLDAVGLYPDNFIFIGIQKAKPFNVYEINMNVSHDRQLMLKNGRSKNERLLRDAYNESIKPNGWKPSSWSRLEGAYV